MGKTKYMYRNTAFFYVAFDGCLMWYTAEDKYLGTTDNSVHSAHEFLDTQII